MEDALVKVDAPAGGVNNIVLRITFFDVHNKQVEQRKSRLFTGTTSERFEIFPRKAYPTGRVCGSLTENGVERPGACLSLHP